MSKILVAIEPSASERSEMALYRELGRLQGVVVSDEGVMALNQLGLHSDDAFEAVIMAVRFRHLAALESLDWHGFSGARVMYDTDALQNYSTLGGGRRLGRWPEVFRRHRFDSMIVTGKEVATRLTDDGVPAVWIPKGYDPARFFDVGEPRAGLCHYGTPYTSRRLVLRALSRSGIGVAHRRVEYVALNRWLNSFAAGLVCNMEVSRLAARINRISRNRTAVGKRSLRPGPEVMLKNFEIAAAGCAMVTDATPELRDLGFEDGKSAIVYSSVEELIEKLRFYMAEPPLLAGISGCGRELVAERHTWALRARAIADHVADVI